MAHGEVAHSAEDERCCVLCDQGRQHGEPSVRAHHRLLGPRRLGEGASPDRRHEPIDGSPAEERATDESVTDVGDESAVDGRGPTCRSEQDGWAGAHRHGAVRPRKRKGRRERPPRRWC
ncbi:hypothetical protein [Micromonospora sp. NPDC049679]|uniref:hypothetical protein n=1 Tax=Micromonospora sp. NPDC049679 TaxID=3155920 RepID=UPI0033C71A9D